MTTDDTSRDALIERVARVLDVGGAFCGECGNEPGDFYDECSQCRRFLTRYASAVVDAVVMPLAQERDRLRGELARRLCTHCARSELDAAIKRAEAAEARTVTAEQVEAAEAAIVEVLHDADEDGEGLDDLDLAQRAVAVTLNALGLRAGGEQA